MVVNCPALCALLMVAIILSGGVKGEKDMFKDIKDQYKKLVTAGKAGNEPCEPYADESKETADYAKMSAEDIKKQIEDANKGSGAPINGVKIIAQNRVAKMRQFIGSAQTMCAMNQGLFCSDEKKCVECKDPVIDEEKEKPKYCEEMLKVKAAGEGDWGQSSSPDGKGETKGEPGAKGCVMLVRPVNLVIALGIATGLYIQ